MSQRVEASSEQDPVCTDELYQLSLKLENENIKHAFNPSTQETEARGLLPFQASLGYIVGSRLGLQSEILSQNK